VRHCDEPFALRTDAKIWTSGAEGRSGLDVIRPSLNRYTARERVSAMGLLTFALNVTLIGCCDHREMVANDKMLRY
jgi:hypothetical protein